MSVWIYYAFETGENEPVIRAFQNRADAVQLFKDVYGDMAATPDWQSGDVDTEVPEWHWINAGCEVYILTTPVE
jgi:hypothetical protein